MTTVKQLIDQHDAEDEVVRSELTQTKSELATTKADLATATAAKNSLTTELSVVNSNFASTKTTLDTERLANSAAQAALVAARDAQYAIYQGTISDLNDRIAELEAAIPKDLPASAGSLPVGEASYDIPNGAFYADAVNGNDSNTGSASSPKKTAKAAVALASVLGSGTVVLKAGTYNEALTTAAGKFVTIMNYPGHAVWFDGNNTLKNFLVASGKVRLLGLGIKRYSPTVTDTNANGFAATIYLGGNVGGSYIENCYVQSSAMSSIETGLPDTIIRFNTLEDGGKSGIMGTKADRSVIEFNTIRRLNRGNYPAEPTTAGIKITRTDSLIIRYNHVSDIPSAYGIWLDVSDTRYGIYGNNVDGRGVGGRAAMTHCIEVEESDGGYYDKQYWSYIFGNSATGATNAGIKVLCTGWTKIFNNDLRGNGMAIWFQQDRPKNSGTQVAAGNRTTLECPWWTVNNEVVNNILDGPSQLWAYADITSNLAGQDMFSRFEGNWMGPKQSTGIFIRIGRKGSNTTDSLSLAQLQSTYPTKASGNYNGTTPPASLVKPLPDDIKSLVGITDDGILGPVFPAILPIV